MVKEGVAAMPPCALCVSRILLLAFNDVLRVESDIFAAAKLLPVLASSTDLHPRENLFLVQGKVWRGCDDGGVGRRKTADPRAVRGAPTAKARDNAPVGATVAVTRVIP